MITRRSPGFTLIEILIAMTIMAALTVFTANSIRSSLTNSSKYRQQIEEMSELRSVIRIIEKDINLAFNYRSVQLEVYNQVAKERGKSRLKNPGSYPPPGSDPNNASALHYREVANHTHFKGADTSLNFTSLSNTRTIIDSKESDQAEIGYYLESCASRGSSSDNERKRSSCLWRRISTQLDEDIEKGGEATPILEGVKAFKLRYLAEIKGTEEPQWLDTWDSKSTRDQRSVGKFPEAVEIHIEVERPRGEKKVPQEVTTIAALRFPNNPPPPPAPAAPGSEEGDNQEEEEPDATPPP